jgi:hypothetical protein
MRSLCSLGRHDGTVKGKRGLSQKSTNYTILYEKDNAKKRMCLIYIKIKFV